MDLGYLPKKDNSGEKADWVMFLLAYLSFMILEHEIDGTELKEATFELYKDLLRAFNKKRNALKLASSKLLCMQCMRLLMKLPKTGSLVFRAFMGFLECDLFYLQSPQGSLLGSCH